jgi:N6-adenosine-specific RNA methylase IME4
LKSLAENIEMSWRHDKLSWQHHYEVASIKKTEEDKKGRLKLSDDPDMEKIQELLALAEKQNLSVRAFRDAVTRYKRQQQERIRLANEPTKYPIFYADPPWKYSDELIEGYGAAVHHYPPMPIKELCALPVQNRAADAAVLFLWVTSPILDECWPVIKSWGFEYKASFVWDKVRHNYGHYNSVRHELLLICTRGSYLPENGELVDSVISLERTLEHSVKPEYFRELIDKMYPTGKRIELFARGEIPKHWDRWGDE